MRCFASEKAEINQMVEHSHLPARGNPVPLPQSYLRHGEARRYLGRVRARGKSKRQTRKNGCWSCRQS